MKKTIIIGGSSGSGSAIATSNLPTGYSSSWMTPPAITGTAVNGKTDVIALMCNVLDIGNRNYFSCIATGAYTVNVYTAPNGTLISTVNTATNVQTNWQIDYAACTHQVNVGTRQAYVEIVPQAGQSLTMVGFNTNHPAETNTNSAPNIVAAFAALPSLTVASSMFGACYNLQSVTLLDLPALTNATNMFGACYALQSVAFGALPALTNASSMFGACYAMQSVTLPALPALTNATSMFSACLGLQSVTLPALPAVTTATSMFSNCYALQSVVLPVLPALTTATSMFGTTVESTCSRSLRKLITPSLGTALPAATTFVLRYTAIQETEALAWVASLGSSANAVTFDLRNNPFSTSTLIAPAISAKFPNATVLRV